jgi:hypothetical protein
MLSKLSRVVTNLSLNWWKHMIYQPKLLNRTIVFKKRAFIKLLKCDYQISNSVQTNKTSFPASTSTLTRRPSFYTFRWWLWLPDADSSLTRLKLHGRKYAKIISEQVFIQTFFLSFLLLDEKSISQSSAISLLTFILIPLLIWQIQFNDNKSTMG